MPEPDLGQASWVHPPWEDRVMEREQDAEEGPKGRLKSGWQEGKAGHRADPGGSICRNGPQEGGEGRLVAEQVSG